MSSRLERLLKLDAYLLGSKYPSLQQLCNVLDTSPRTVYMDLRELRDRFGRDIRFCKINHGYYHAKATASLPCPSASDADIALLLAAVETLAQLTGPRVKVRLINLLSQLCGDKLAPLSRKIGDSILVSENNELGKDQKFIDVLDALVAEQQLRMNGDTDNPSVQLQPPFKIRLCDNEWVVSGYQNDASLQVRLDEIDLDQRDSRSTAVEQEQAS